MFRAALLVSALTAMVSVSPAMATIHVYDFVMDGFQETPPVATPGTGNCHVTLDDLSFDYTVNCTFSGLIGTTNNAHIHGPAPIGSPASVIVGLTFDFGVTAGNITGAGTLSAVNAQHVLDGNTYVNLHTTFRPGGEIRGQIVPEPATAMLLAFGGLIAIRRRRRR
ncbi:MAG TPA: CHRD domain-containing protein [Phycisphaerae bacterium]|nr:CHRD domain-containing protein [Phycisphaerae bacterium]